MNPKTETNAAMPANQDNVAQETSVQGKYASVGDLKMYYETHGAGDHWFCFTVLSCRQPSIRHSLMAER